MEQLTLAKPKNEIILRDYQQQAYDDLFEKINQGKKRIMVVAPCSWGKTAFISQIILKFKNEGKKVLFIVPALSLIEQARRDFKKAGITCGIIAGGHKPDYGWRVQIASIQTLTRRIEMAYKPDVIILDEAHETAFHGWVKRELPLLLNGQEIIHKSQLTEYLELLGLNPNVSYTWKDITKHYNTLKKIEGLSIETRTGYQYLKKYQCVFQYNKQPNDRLIIGLTATPWRLKKSESMADVFSCQTLRETPRQMIEMGMLTPCIYYRLKEVSLKGVKTTQTGDYRDDQLSLVMSDPEVVKDAVSNYKRICPNRKFICFAVNLAHANALLKEFNAQGIESVLISGEMPDKQRQPLFDRMRNLSDPLMGLISVGCISVGFSVNEISCIVHCRPTKSASLYIQGIGRGQRLAEGKENCVIIDQAHNTKRFGFIEDIVYPKLDHNNTFMVGESPVKECENCGLIQPIINKECSDCGHEFESKESKSKVTPKGNLELVISNTDKPVYDRYRLNLAIAYQRSYDPDWAKMKTHQETGKFPHKEWAIGAIFGIGIKGIDSPVNQSKYWAHLKQLSIKLDKKQLDRLRQGYQIKRLKVYDYNWMQSQFKIIFGFEYKPIKLINRPDNSLLDLMEF